MRVPGTVVAALLLCAGALLAAPPAEVTGVRFDAPATLGWDPTAGAQDYNVYRGDLADLAAGNPPACHGDEIVPTTFQTPTDPAPGRGFAYLVSAENSGGEEGSAGQDSGAVERATFGKCDAVVFQNVLNRLGFGWSEWNRDRLQTLGYTAYRDEQLDPDSIDQSTNTELNNRLPAWSPPDNDADLQYTLIDQSIYSWRQLEWQATEFWLNHFSTYYDKTYLYMAGVFLDEATRHFQAARQHELETEAFRDFAFNGNFREILEQSALKPPMLIFLDAQLNTQFKPNENHARELLELHTMGVDNGYDETDVRELTKVLTGWSVCKKIFADVGDPLAPCVDPLFGPQGDFTAHFNPADHDSSSKTLFAGTPEELVIPDTSGDPVTGIDDIYMALDTLADHPSTKEFISTKLLQRFVTEDPTPALVQAVVAEWDDGTNPQGVGDLREILRAVLDPANVLNPDFVGQKVKTPHEHVVGIYRSMRGGTNFLNMPFVRNHIFLLGMLSYRNAVPTGYPEAGGDWINTNAMLTRQDLGMVYAFDGFYGGQIDQLVNENSLTTDVAIVEFFADLLFGGALTPLQRQQALDYLNTDDLGNPSPFDNLRIRETVGFMMGFPQFIEQ